MSRYAIALLLFISLLASYVPGQKANIQPIHVAVGTVLGFHLQTRLNPNTTNEMDILPKGTVLWVKILNPIDSNVDRDGSEFRGAVVSSVTAGNEIVLHSDSEVQGLLALLRSRSHPDGFRYELLLTRISDHGKSYDLTASLNPSFFEGATESAGAAKSGTTKNPEGGAPKTN